jgi:hypothetical protein
MTDGGVAFGVLVLSARLWPTVGDVRRRGT